MPSFGEKRQKGISNMDRSKLKNYDSMWRAIEERIGGELGRRTVEALHELYAVYDDRLIEWQASLYDPEVGGWYFSKSGQANEGFLPDVESTIAALGFWEESGMLGDKSFFEATPDWLRRRIGEFVYPLQDEDGYFYHPQWGKNIGALRKSRDLGTGIRLLRVAGLSPKYPTPTSSAKSEELSLELAPERFKSVENYEKYLDTELDFVNKAYVAGSHLSSGIGEIIAYGKLLGCDLVELIVKRLDKAQNRDTGLWHPELCYDGTNAVHKCSKIYNWTGRRMEMVDKMIESTMKVILSVEQSGSAVSLMNIWYVLGSLLENKRKFGHPDEMSYEEAVRRIREFAPEGILATARQMTAFKAPDGGMSAGIEHCQTSVYGSPTSMPGSNEGDVNGSACASSALVKGVYYGLDIPELKVPLYSEEDFKKYVSILEAREERWRRYGEK